MMLSIAIAGAGGRMGRALIAAAAQRNDLHIVGGTERADALPRDVAIPVSTDVAAAAANADVWIDFSAPGATVAALDALAPTNVRAAIVGTTGLSSEQEAKIAAAAKRIAVVRSGNFSLGVNLLAHLAREAAKRLGSDWDVEIVEAHHRRKVDAPSGTALLLGEAVAEGRNVALLDARLAPHDGITGARPEGGIGFASVRGGGIVGEHDVMFAAERELITLSHQALDRAVFADGALAAALWAQNKPAGLYSMKDVLGL
ncbi:MAG TPA: 4-hydroxy-tetrahydrodipicolinate reductase [Caulobacterales bacterium]|nr:4-hydroxy-tetrahydrodipicolinate reductase [Caulobacterales bacterium]